MISYNPKLLFGITLSLLLAAGTVVSVADDTKKTTMTEKVVEKVKQAKNHVRREIKLHGDAKRSYKQAKKEYKQNKKQIVKEANVRLETIKVDYSRMTKKDQKQYIKNYLKPNKKLHISDYKAAHRAQRDYRHKRMQQSRQRRRRSK